MKLNKKYSSLLALVLSVMLLLPASADVQATDANNALGIVHTSYIQPDGTYSNFTPLVGSYRYSDALATGSRWNRLPFYWSDIQKSSKDSFSWQTPGNAWDTVIDQDRANGITTQPILMLTPLWALPPRTPQNSVPPPQVGQGRQPLLEGEQAIKGKTPAATCDPSQISPYINPPDNVYGPIFASGADTPQPGDAINASNPWAWFIYQTALHFKGRVTNWEVWNEPDYVPSTSSNCFGFFNGTPKDYARLLQVAYMALKFADSNNTIIMGGMSYWPDLSRNGGTWTFFPQVLDNLKNNTTGPASSYNYFFDVTAWHWYSQPDQLYYKDMDVRNALNARGMGNKRIWVNESGIPAWNNLPQRINMGPCSWPTSTTGFYYGSATQDGQARYPIESLAYGYAAGVERIFHFQLQDDGNCEAFGLVRNDQSLRPAYTALTLASRYLRGWSSTQVIADGQVQRIIFNDTPNGRVSVIFNKGTSAITYYMPAAARNASFVRKDGSTGTLTAQTGYYQITLGGASDNGNSQSAGYLPGDPLFVIESGVSGASGTLNGLTLDMLGRPLAGVAVNRVTGPSSATLLGYSAGTGTYSVQAASGLNSLSGSLSGYISNVPVYAQTQANTTSTARPLYLARSQEVIQNGSFEQGTGPANAWAYTADSDTPAINTVFDSYGGDRSIVLGCNPPNQGANPSVYHKSAIYQSVYVPTNIGEPVLALNYMLPSYTGQNAWLEIMVDSRGKRYYLASDQPGSWSPSLRWETGGWLHRAYSLAAIPDIAGSNVTVIISMVRRDDVRDTVGACYGPFARIDDVSISPAATIAQPQASSPVYATGPFSVNWGAFSLPDPQSYDVQYSINNGAWVDWLAGTTAQSATFSSVTDGARYAFRVRSHTGSFISEYRPAGDTSTLVDQTPPTAFNLVMTDSSGQPANNCSIWWVKVNPPATDPAPPGGTASGLAGYTYEVQQNGVWRTLQNSTSPQLWFVGQNGQSYIFRVTAKDQAGNTQQSSSGTVLAGSDRCGFSTQILPQTMRGAGSGW